MNYAKNADKTEDAVINDEHIFYYHLVTIAVIFA